MVYSLTYRRPSRNSWSSDDTLSDEYRKESINESIASGNSGMNHGIPAALSFDKIISSGTCPPCTLRDFMNYLKYIEYSAENLQFFLWYRDYCARFDNLPESEKALSPAWDAKQHEVDLVKKKTTVQVTELPANDGRTEDKPRVLLREEALQSPPGDASSLDEKQSTSSERSSANSGRRPAGRKWRPFCTQPYREEISRIIGVYIAKDAPRELNLSGRERFAVLQALQDTTHPSAFQAVVTSVEYSLRKQAHPNFIRWSICNGNPPRVTFARGLGVATIVLGLIADILITLSNVGRGWRVLPMIGWFIGIATLIAAWKGMCVVLHGMHHRHLRPWELFCDGADLEANEKMTSRDSLISRSTNSFEDEPWVPKYKKRNLVRKVFDREIWIEEPALRQIQDTIFLQAVLGALALSCIAVGVFCAVPHGNFF